MLRSTRGRCASAFVLLGLLAIVVAPAYADETQSAGSRFEQPLMQMHADGIPTLHSIITPVNTGGGPVGAPRGTCPPEVQTYSDTPFDGHGTVTFPAGMVEQEIAAVTYTVPPTNWPLIVRTGEILWGQNHLNDTTTAYTFLVWQGAPNTGTLIASYSSDDVVLDHIRLPNAGSQVVNLAVTIDPGDADQIIVMNDGSNKFSIGFRIDSHNNPPASPCSEPCLGLGTLPAICCPPDENSNAWPGMDAMGPGEYGTQEWLYARTCPGATGLCSLAVDSGWHTLASLPSTGSGGEDYLNDWAIRVTYEPFNCVVPTGACCKPDGTCEELTADACSTASGIYEGDGTPCSAVQCPQPTGACCFMPTGCVVLTEGDCDGAQGFWSGPGTDCSTTVCFPTGACCMPDGSCQDEVLDTDCLGMNGSFNGDGSVCANISCPQPQGACCLTTGFCLVLDQASCAQIPDSQWLGLGTDCTDADMNGTADDCEGGNPCDGVLQGDFDGSGTVDGDDLEGLIQAIMSGSPSQGEICAGDFNGNGSLDVGDIAGMVSALLN